MGRVSMRRSDERGMLGYVLKWVLDQSNSVKRSVLKTLLGSGSFGTKSMLCVTQMGELAKLFPIIPHFF